MFAIHSSKLVWVVVYQNNRLGFIHRQWKKGDVLRICIRFIFVVNDIGNHATTFVFFFLSQSFSIIFFYVIKFWLIFHFPFLAIFFYLILLFNQLIMEFNLWLMITINDGDDELNLLIYTFFFVLFSSVMEKKVFHSPTFIGDFRFLLASSTHTHTHTWPLYKVQEIFFSLSLSLNCLLNLSVWIQTDTHTQILVSYNRLPWLFSLCLCFYFIFSSNSVWTKTAKKMIFWIN